MKLRVLALVTGALMLSACGKGAAPVEPATPAESAPKPEAVATVGITPVDIPAGFGYPGNRDEFQAWADTWKIDSITSTAWNLWAGMTSDSGQKWNGSTLPIWETWCGTEEAFSAAGCKTLSRPSHAFKAPVQIGHSARITGVAPVASDTQVVSFNKFNPAMADYLAAQHPGPGSAQYSYTSMQSQVDLNAAWPQNTAVGDRKVVDAPYQPDSGDVMGYSAIETKPVMFLVKNPSNLPAGQVLTPMPLWQGTAQSNVPANAVPESWFNCVLLDPTNTSGPTTAPVAATPEQVKQLAPNSTFSCDPSKYLYAPLSTIYNFQMDQAEADAWNAAQAGSGVKAQAGDYSVLAAMHVNTKTITNWTWQTFWWQPGQDAPGNIPGSKQGMTSNIAGAWRNYAMCTAWNQTQGNASDKMVVCFNPFLETSSGIPAGQTSNCMSCHGTATFGAAVVSGNPPANAATSMNYPANYKAPIDFNGNACTQSTPAGGPTTCFANFTKTDFSWAIPVNARNDLPQPATGSSASK